MYMLYKMEQPFMEFSQSTNQGNTMMGKEHFHPFYEIYYLQKGYCDYLIEGQLYHIEAGDIVLINKFLLHKTRYPKSIETKRLLINFDEDYIHAIHEKDKVWLLDCFNTNNPIIRFNNVNLNNQLIRLFADFYELSASKPMGYHFQLETCFRQLLMLFCKSGEQDFIPPKEPTEIEKKILDIAYYIHQNYHYSMNLKSLANEFYISQHYLSHKFKAVTGFTVTDYIQSIRIKNAQELLMNTNIKILEISEQCGFGSVSQFQRVFRRHCDLTPRQFRQVKQSVS